MYKWIKWVKWCMASVIMLVLVYSIIERKDSWSNALNQEWQMAEITAAIILILLMPINILLESLKWRNLSNISISLGQFMKASFAGIAVGFLTPNRVGEYGGRILFIPKNEREKGVAATVLGNWAQLSVTIVLGLIGIIILFFSDFKHVLVNSTWALLAGILLPVSFMLYFKANRLVLIMQKVKVLSKFKEFFKQFKIVTTQDLGIAWGYSFFRFAVFSVQLSLAVFIFMPDSFGYYLFLLIPVYYLAHSIIPTIALAEIGVRGVLLSAILIGVGNVASPGAYLAGAFVWLVNLCLPALIGALLLIVNPNHD